MILIADDDRAICASLKMLLKRAGYSAATAFSMEEALAAVRRDAPQLIMMDMNFTGSTSGSEGLELLRKVKVLRPEVPVVLMTAWASIPLAVKGMQLGAADFVAKPWDNRALLETIATAIVLAPGGERDGRDVVDDDGNRCGIVGQSPEIAEVMRMIFRVAPTDAPVLITGENGTGKELAARAIHANSRRAAGPFVAVNLGALPPTLFESEMFGHVRGAFTGATADRVGRFEAAEGGTLFLDEVGTLDPMSQVKLLRALQEHTFEPVGSSRTRRANVRVICATNADLPAAVAAGSFREDLYYRINLIGIKLPPLRERAADIPTLAAHFCAQLSRSPATFSADALAWLRAQPWPGNIRQLRNVVERTLLLNDSPQITAEMLARSSDPAAAPTSASDSDSAATQTLDQLERQAIVTAIARQGGNLTAVAATLGITRQALYRRMDKYGLRHDGGC